LNTFDKGTRFIQVTGILEGDRFTFRNSEWKLLVETSRYYEIKPDSGSVKRLYKEKLHVILNDSSHYKHAALSCTAFCLKEREAEIRLQILLHLKRRIQELKQDLQLNLDALERATGQIT